MITIIGAGMAGLLAANMLRHRQPSILEKQSSLPNNHSAVLRFRTSVVGDVTGIPFRKVNVLKATLPWLNPIADALAYSNKNTGTYLSNRSIPTEIVSAERYIAPYDFIEQLAKPINIAYDIDVSKMFLDDGKNAPGFELVDCPIISTIPMPVLMDLLDYKGERPEFKSVQGTNIIAHVQDCDAYVSLYVPDPEYPFSRISITGNELIIEMPTDDLGDASVNDIVEVAAGFLGVQDNVCDIRMKPQSYAKIQEVDDDLRKQFIHWATIKHNVYSLGRYAVWRPKLLLDDLVQDIRLIDKWMNCKNKYDVTKVH